MTYPTQHLSFENEEPENLTPEEEAEWQDRLLTRRKEVEMLRERLDLTFMYHSRRNKFDSQLFLMQCDWDELPFYKKWWFHICKFFGVWYDWNNGKYMD